MSKSREVELGNFGGNKCIWRVQGRSSWKCMRGFCPCSGHRDVHDGGDDVCVPVVLCRFGHSASIPICLPFWGWEFTRARPPTVIYCSFLPSFPPRSFSVYVPLVYRRNLIFSLFSTYTYMYVEFFYYYCFLLCCICTEVYWSALNSLLPTELG